MRDWSKINKASIVTDRSLLLDFTNDYSFLYGNLNIGCRQCIDDAYRKLILNFNKMKQSNNCDYQLKAKYEGIFFDGKPIRNGDLTNKLAKTLLKKHSAGASLFEKMPVAVVKSDSELSLKDLRLKYPNITANSKDKFLAKLD